MGHKESCLICENTNLEPFLFFYSRYNPRLFHRIAICKDCGHIQIYPLFNEKQYTKINSKFFGKLYMIDNRENTENNLHKLVKMDEILSSYIHPGLNVLDVGAGEAWAMKYYQEKQCNYFAIEVVERLANLIRDREGEVIGKSLFDDYLQYQSKFNIIFLHGVIEHFLSPQKALSVLKYLLAPNGLIYLSFPDAGSLYPPKIFKKGFRTSYIRPVHISYFCSENFIRLTNSVGLNSIHLESTGLIFCLLKHGSKEGNINSNHYEKQKRIFLTMAKQNFAKDVYRIARGLGSLVKNII